ncbi:MULTISPECIES: hypothetical protein [unclassified Streptomyces]|uniref:hypothetical protein n=1 Tax=unclassified Streptomyces TaxID=2593676 RepID=UPI003D74D855
MGAGWVAGVTRARAMTATCAGPRRAHRVAAAADRDEAWHVLAGTAYRRDPVERDEGPRTVADVLVWQLRVLAGWQPRAGAAALRLLASGFEIANTRSHLRALSGVPQPPPYRLGALSTAWTRLARTASPAEVRAVLASSVWGDPGGEAPASVVAAMRLSAAARTAAGVPHAARWTTGGAALLVARETFLAGRRPEGQAARQATVLLGRGALSAVSYGDYRARLPADARWALGGSDRPEDLWRAEARWWREVEQDGQRLLRGTSPGPAPVVGAAAVLATDARRVRAALECAAYGGRAVEAFDELLG